MIEGQESGERLDLRQLLLVVRRRWWLAVVCMCLVAGAALLFSLSEQKQYTATSSLLLRDVSLGQELLTPAVSMPAVDPTRQEETNIQLVSSPAVAAQTASALHMPLSEVNDDVSVSAEGQTNIVSVSATNPSPQVAARLANTYAQQAVAFSRDLDRSQILQARDAVQTQLNGMSGPQLSSAYGQALLTRSQELQTLAAADTGGAQVAALANPPSSPSAPKTKRNVALGLALGLLLGLAAMAFAERWSRRVREPEELGEIHGLPVLSEIPQSRSMANGNGVALANPEREAFRMLLAKLRYANPEGEVRSVLVTSAGAKEGKSTIAWHLAETHAARGKDRVLLIETDLRKPVFAARHHLKASPGLRDVLQRRTPVSQVIQTVDIPRPDGSAKSGSMDVIVAGRPSEDPMPLLESPRMGQILLSLSKIYDFIVLDTAPSLLAAETMPLMGKVGGVLVVSRVGVTTRDQARFLREELEALDAPLLGVIANGVKYGGERYGYYSYGETGGGHRRRLKTRRS